MRASWTTARTRRCAISDDKVLYAHGGVAGTPKPELSLAAAVAAGMRGLTALDIVEQSVLVMEDDPRLNAGFGSVLNRVGELELDAGIVDGATGSFGGVANVTVAHPITLARRVLEKTPHALITGAGARALGSDMPTLAPTEQQLVRWRDALGSGAFEGQRFGAAEFVDTVGAVGLDAQGKLAAGSSTGGVFGKLPGRVGDAPIHGAGLYASRRVAAVGTGVGEVFLETLACRRVARLIEHGEEPQTACEAVISDLGRVAQVAAGLLALDADGRVGAAYRGGSWSVETVSGPLAAACLGPAAP